MTVTMLLVNTISAAERTAGLSRDEPRPEDDEAEPAAAELRIRST
jgi:hypothetical protein